MPAGKPNSHNNIPGRTKGSGTLIRAGAVWTLLATLLLASACSLTAPGQDLPAASTISDKNSTPTLTPFQPLPDGMQSVASPEPGPTNAPSLQAAQPTATETASETPGEPTETPTPSSTPQPPSPEASFSLWVDPLLPAGLRSQVAMPADFKMVEDPNGAMLRLEVGSDRPVARWVYALVAPFPTIVPGVTSEDLKSAWSGDTGGIPPGGALLLGESALHSLSALWGDPSPQSVQVLPPGELLDQAWSRHAWAIVPFEALQPRWKVLEIDGNSPIRKDFNEDVYPLSLPISLNGDPLLAETVRDVSGDTLVPVTNRDPDRLTILAMSGVTALVRGTAFAMERKGIQYPALDVGDWLREADLTHISNEVPFAQDCPYPDPFQADMRFCSDPRYIGLLESIGTDIIELTGDHFQDWGTAAMKLTLKMYQERGWPYYGGGANLEEGRRALIVEHNGNRLAFIGCNAKGGSFAQAGADHPGAAACNLEWMGGEIARLRESGYLPVVTFQHFEYYTYQAQPNQERDFKSMAAAGAVIVSGSQAHQPQALSFYKNALIHYGLGNLFFDQYDVSAATRQAFIDRHVFYDGRHISSELLPIVFVDYARPRPMTAQEARELFEAVFTASGW